MSHLLAGSILPESAVKYQISRKVPQEMQNFVMK